MLKISKNTRIALLPIATLAFVFSALAINTYYFDSDTGIATRAERPTQETYFDFQGTPGDWRVENFGVLAHQSPNEMVVQVSNSRIPASLVSPYINREISDASPEVQVMMRLQPMRSGRFVTVDQAWQSIPLTLQFITENDPSWNEEKSVTVSVNPSSENQLVTFFLAHSGYVSQGDFQSADAIDFVRLTLPPSHDLEIDTLEMSVDWFDLRL